MFAAAATAAATDSGRALSSSPPLLAVAPDPIPSHPMGCVGSKQFHGANLHKSARPPSSTSNHSDSLRHLATYDSTKGLEEEEPEEAADSTAATPLALPDQVLIVTDKEEAPGVDANAAPEPKPKLSLVAHVPNGVDWEHVAAGWPRWLTQVATEAVRGWLPRKSDSFHKLHKVVSFSTLSFFFFPFLLSVILSSFLYTFGASFSSTSSLIVFQDSNLFS